MRIDAKKRYAAHKRYGRKHNIGYKARKILPRGLQLNLHKFIQTYYPSSTSLTTDGTNCLYQPVNGDLLGPSTTASGDGFFSLKFLLSDCPQAATFAALFDAYMLRHVKVKFVPLVNMVNQSSTTAGASTAITQFLETVIDYDDASLPTTENQLLDYQSFKQSAGYRQQTRSITPCVSQMVYKTSGTTIAYSQKRHVWIDLQAQDAEWYGIKGCVPTTSTAAANMQLRWKIYITAEWWFKQVR